MSVFWIMKIFMSKQVKTTHVVNTICCIIIMCTHVFDKILEHQIADMEKSTTKMQNQYNILCLMIYVCLRI